MDKKDKDITLNNKSRHIKEIKELYRKTFKLLKDPVFVQGDRNIEAITLAALRGFYREVKNQEIMLKSRSDSPISDQMAAEVNKDKKIKELESEIRMLEYKLKEQDKFIDDMFKMYKKHKDLKFRNITRG